MFLSIDIIEAREALLDMQVLDYQQGDKRFREKLRRKLHEVAYPMNKAENIKTVSPDELVRIFGSG